MDTMRHVDAKDTLGETVGRSPRRLRTVAEKRRIVEETLKPGASVAVVARRHEVNANLVFGWRRLYRQGLLEVQALAPVAMLPVKVSTPTLVSTKRLTRGKSEGRVHPRPSSWSSIEIEFATGERLRLHGRVEREVLARVIEVLLRR
jgi:transposase